MTLWHSARTRSTAAAAAAASTRPDEHCGGDGESTMIVAISMTGAESRLTRDCQSDRGAAQPAAIELSAVMTKTPHDRLEAGERISRIGAHLAPPT